MASNNLLAIELAKEQAEKFEAQVTKVDGHQAFSVDLPSQTITCPDGTKFAFDIRPAEKMALLEGLDDIGLTLEKGAAIDSYEDSLGQSRPWV